VFAVNESAQAFHDDFEEGVERFKTLYPGFGIVNSYGRWLPNSSAFGGIVDVTPHPVPVGTTQLRCRAQSKTGLGPRI